MRVLFLLLRRRSWRRQHFGSCSDQRLCLRDRSPRSLKRPELLLERRQPRLQLSFLLSRGLGSLRDLASELFDPLPSGGDAGVLSLELSLQRAERREELLDLGSSLFGGDQRRLAAF